MTKPERLARIRGKFTYIWLLKQIFGGDVDKIVAELLRADVAGVAIKAHNGTDRWDEPSFQLDKFIPACKDAGIEVLLWGYVYLKFNPVGEARAALDMIETYKDSIVGYLIDAETEAKSATPTDCRVFMTILRSGAPDIPIALNSYRFPHYHPELQWGILRAGTDFDCPQVYYRNTDPVINLLASKREYVKLGGGLPFIPAGDMYKEHGISPTPAAVQEFLKTCRDASDIPAAIMWTMDQMGPAPELWRAFADFSWPSGRNQPVKPPPVVLPKLPAPMFSGVVTASVLNVRAGAGMTKPILSKLLYGAPVRVYAVLGSWGMISVPGDLVGPERWVSLSWVRKV